MCHDFGRQSPRSRVLTFLSGESPLLMAIIGPNWSRWYCALWAVLLGPLEGQVNPIFQDYIAFLSPFLLPSFSHVFCNFGQYNCVAIYLPVFHLLARRLGRLLLGGVISIPRY
jgi:hypothetical protein